MRVEQLGTGTPEVAVVGAIHGDEPCGARAIENILDADPHVQMPVKLIIANEEALHQGVRYIDADLNRAFTSDVDESAHEYQLARRLADELTNCRVLSLHSTQSHPNPFGIINEENDRLALICQSLSIEALVKVTEHEGRLFAIEADLIEVEAGLQQSTQAIDNATRLTQEFLTATNVLPGETNQHEVPVYKLGTSIKKQPAETYEVYVENFAQVDAGETFAAADGEPIIADESFIPVLLSAYGYTDIFGYAAERIGTIG